LISIKIPEKSCEYRLRLTVKFKLSAGHNTEGKIAEKAVCRSVFLTTRTLYFECPLGKTDLSDLLTTNICFNAICLQAKLNFFAGHKLNRFCSLIFFFSKQNWSEEKFNDIPYLSSCNHSSSLVNTCPPTQVYPDTTVLKLYKYIYGFTLGRQRLKKFR